MTDSVLNGVLPSGRTIPIPLRQRRRSALNSRQNRSHMTEVVGYGPGGTERRTRRTATRAPRACSVGPVAAHSRRLSIRSLNATFTENGFGTRRRDGSIEWPTAYRSNASTTVEASTCSAAYSSAACTPRRVSQSSTSTTPAAAARRSYRVSDPVTATTIVAFETLRGRLRRSSRHNRFLGGDEAWSE